MFLYLLVTVLPDLPEAKLKLLLTDDSIGSGASEKYCSSPTKRNVMSMLNQMINIIKNDHPKEMIC